MEVYLGNRQIAGSHNAVAGSFPQVTGDRGVWPSLGHTRADSEEPVCNDLEDKVQHDLDQGSQGQISLGPLASSCSPY